MTIIRKPIFILGSHKSGSSLVRSLLDGHPDLFVIPSESHYFQLTGHCVDFKMRRSEPKQLSLAEKIDKMAAYIHHENMNNDPHGAVMIENRYNENRFLSYIQHNEDIDERELFSLYLRAYHVALYGTDLADNIRVVEKSIEHAEFAPLLLKWFPDAKFIHIVRNPYATLVASRNTGWQKGYPYLGTYLESLRNSNCNLFHNMKCIDNYKVIRYEDLVSDAQSVMQGIAEHLEIPMNDIMLQPTLCGENWAGNSSSNKKFTGINSSPTSKWMDSIKDLEVVLTNRVSRPIFTHFKYELLSPKHHPWKQRIYPIKGESLKRYFRNRALLLTL